MQQNGDKTPETVVASLARRLRSHVLRDSLLTFGPPLVVSLYLLVHIHRAAWIPQSTFIVLTGAAIAIGLLAVVMRYRPMLPSSRSAARLVDEKTAAEDRFLTLATIEPSLSCQPFLARLRQETSGFLPRVDLRRDFPYAMKRSFYRSVIASIAVAVLFHLLLPVVQSTIAPPASHQQISQLAEKMAQKPSLAALARNLQSLASKLQDPNLELAEKQQLIQEMQKKIAEQQKNQKQQDNQDLLGEAASTLEGMEQQSGTHQQNEQDKGGAGVQSKAPEQGAGEGKQSQGSGGDSKGDLNAQQNKEMQQGKTAEADSKEQANDKHQGPQDGPGKQPDKNQPGKEQGKEMKGKTEGGAEEQVGKSKSEGKGRSEENPQGAPLAERFTKPGEEGRGGLKGAGYVTVQLPEEMAAEGKAESGATREGRPTKARPKVPVSNVPLPAHVPDAPSEKQNFPLEYRGIIR
jgi:hypothetical protein